MPKCGELDLPSGRRLFLRHLQQYVTYAGRLEGFPTAGENKRTVQRLIAEYRDRPYPGEPYLIPPTERPIEFLGGRRYPFGTPSALPAVTCIGRFESLSPARDPQCDGSGLVVIWFQEEFAFPIDASVVAQLLTIKWEKHAGDWTY